VVNPSISSDCSSVVPEDLGLGPAAFTGGENVNELYLIKKSIYPPERLYFRWNITQDPSNLGMVCNGSITNTGCLGNLQILKLVGTDKGILHDGTSTGSNDGVIDTWEYGSEYDSGGTNSGWIDVLPNYINVKSVKFYPYPDKNPKYNWKDTAGIAPYVRIQLSLGFSWDRRKQIKSDPVIDVATTINLSK